MQWMDSQMLFGRPGAPGYAAICRNAGCKAAGPPNILRQASRDMMQEHD